MVSGGTRFYGRAGSPTGRRLGGGSRPARSSRPRPRSGGDGRRHRIRAITIFQITLGAAHGQFHNIPNLSR